MNKIVQIILISLPVLIQMVLVPVMVYLAAHAYPVIKSTWTTYAQVHLWMFISALVSILAILLGMFFVFRAEDTNATFWLGSLLPLIPVLVTFVFFYLASLA